MWVALSRLETLVRESWTSGFSVGLFCLHGHKWWEVGKHHSYTTQVGAGTTHVRSPNIIILHHAAPSLHLAPEGVTCYTHWTTPIPPLFIMTETLGGSSSELEVPSQSPESPEATRRVQYISLEGGQGICILSLCHGSQGASPSSDLGFPCGYCWKTSMGWGQGRNTNLEMWP